MGASKEQREAAWGFVRFVFILYWVAVFALYKGAPEGYPGQAIRETYQTDRSFLWVGVVSAILGAIACYRSSSLSAWVKKNGFAWGGLSIWITWWSCLLCYSRFGNSLGLAYMTISVIAAPVFLFGRHIQKSEQEGRGPMAEDS